ncbi:unnamed protein product, partial [Brassica oleracea var. botrytis]
MWPITNHKNKNAFLGTTFICLDIHEQKMEGKVPISTYDTMYERFEEEKIYHIMYFNLLPNNQRYMLTVQPYIININETTIITLLQENIPLIPSNIFRPQHYRQLISLASATNFLP